MAESGSKVLSPCVSLCCLDDDDVCMGCLRHVDEITSWHGMSDDERRELLAELEKRRELVGPLKFPR